MDRINACINSQTADEVIQQTQLQPLKWTIHRELTGKLYGPSSLDMSGKSYSRTKFHRELYNSFGHSSTWNNASGNPYYYGAVFNFDFSPDG